MKHGEEEEWQLWFCTTVILHPMLAAICAAGNSSPEYSEHFWKLFLLLLLLCLGRAAGGAPIHSEPAGSLLEVKHPHSLLERSKQFFFFLLRKEEYCLHLKHFPGKNFNYLFKSHGDILHSWQSCAPWLKVMQGLHILLKEAQLHSFAIRGVLCKLAELDLRLSLFMH